MARNLLIVVKKILNKSFFSWHQRRWFSRFLHISLRSIIAAAHLSTILAPSYIHATQPEDFNLRENATAPTSSNSNLRVREHTEYEKAFSNPLPYLSEEFKDSKQIISIRKNPLKGPQAVYLQYLDALYNVNPTTLADTDCPFEVLEVGGKPVGFQGNLIGFCSFKYIWNQEFQINAYHSFPLHFIHNFPDLKSPRDLSLDAARHKLHSISTSWEHLCPCFAETCEHKPLEPNLNHELPSILKGGLKEKWLEIISTIGELFEPILVHLGHQKGAHWTLEDLTRIIITAYKFNEKFTLNIPDRIENYRKRYQRIFLNINESIDIFSDYKNTSREPSYAGFYLFLTIGNPDYLGKRIESLWELLFQEMGQDLLTHECFTGLIPINPQKLDRRSFQHFFDIALQIPRRHANYLINKKNSAPKEICQPTIFDECTVVEADVPVKFDYCGSDKLGVFAPKTSIRENASRFLQIKERLIEGAQENLKRDNAIELSVKSFPILRTLILDSTPLHITHPLFDDELVSFLDKIHSNSTVKVSIKGTLSGLKTYRFDGINHLHLDIEDGVGFIGTFIAPKLTIDTTYFFPGRTHRIANFATTKGDLTIKSKHKFDARYTNLYSEKTLIIESQEECELGDFIKAPADLNLWLGYARGCLNRLLTTPYFKPNGARIGSGSATVISAPKVTLKGLVGNVGQDLHVCSFDEPLVIRNCVLEGLGNCVLHSTSKVILDTCGTAFLPCTGYCNWKWGCGYKGIGRYAVLSGGSSLNFKDIIFEAHLTELISATVLASDTIIHSGDLQTKTVLEIPPSIPLAAMNMIPRALHAMKPFDSNLIKQFPTVCLSGQKIVMNLGKGDFAGITLNTQTIDFFAKTASFVNLSTRQGKVAEVSMEIDLIDFIDELSKRGATSIELDDKGDYKPVWPWGGKRLKPIMNIPYVSNQSFRGAKDLFEAMQHVPLELLVQRILGTFTKQLSFEKFSGEALFQRIIHNSQNFEAQLFARKQEKGRRQEIAPKALLDKISKSSLPLFYFKDTPEGLRTFLHLSAKMLNPNQSPGDISFDQGKIATQGDLSISDHKITAREGDLVMSSSQGGVTRSKTTGINEVTVNKGNLITVAATHITDVGTQKTVAKKIHQKSAGPINHLAAHQRTVQHSGSDVIVRNTYYPVIQKASEIIIEGDSAFEQSIQQEASDKIVYKLKQGITSQEVSNTYSHTSTDTKKRSFGRSKTSTTTSQSSTVIRPTRAAPHITFHTDFKDIILTADKINTNVMDFSAPEGQLVLKEAIETFSTMTATAKKGFAVNTMTQSGDQRTKVIGVDIDAKEININVKKGIQYSLRSDMQAMESNFHQTLRERNDVVWNLLKDSHNSFHHKHHSLGAGLAVLVNLSVGYATYGLGANLISPFITSTGISGLPATFLTSAFNGGVSSLASTAAITLLNNKGDLNKTFKTLTSSQELRSLAATMIVAGGSSSVFEALNIDTKTAVDNRNLKALNQGQAPIHTLSATSRLQAMLTQTSLRTVTESTLNKKDLGEAFEQALKTGLTGLAGEYAAQEIGVAYKAENSALDYVTHKFAHAILGAAGGLVANQDPLSGCIGAVIGEIIGEAYADAHMKELLGLDPNRNVNTNLQMQNQGLLDPAIREKAVEKGLYLSKSGAALAAMLLKQNPTGAVESADISVRNNAALLLIPLLVEGTIILGGLGLAALATYHIKKAADNGDFRKAATKLIAMGEVLIDSASEQISFLFQGKAYPTMKAVVGAYLIAHNLPFSTFSGSNSLVDPNRNESTEKGETTSKHAPSETKGNNGGSQDNEDEGHNGNNGGNGKDPKNPPPPVKKNSSGDVEKRQSLLDHERQKLEYIKNMEKPKVHDQELKELVDELYKPGSEVGSGSTADALRHEKLTGELVGGKDHLQKSLDRVNQLEKWIRNHENTTRISAQDKQTAKNLLKDLRNALNE